MIESSKKKILTGQVLRAPASYHVHGTYKIMLRGRIRRLFSTMLSRSQAQWKGGLFRLDNYLAKAPSFLQSGGELWQHPIFGTRMNAVVKKLKLLKSIFRAQRRKKWELTLNVVGFLVQAQEMVQLHRQDS
ncbi:hypothetical protein Salat_0850900 [Sesamum alatum]|uniref:Uncharacterized protein n=1 Tax=Sesamum alatum TaxID=300844 RepID=A0AAE1YIH3_9LAMI|nr:hypothetical protein Salat_0850900 [Sesamum alatum]